ncbi:MAG: BatD family protein [Bacteroidota bacterium]
MFGQKFELTADKTTVNQNQRFQVYFTFEGGDGSNLKGFRPPNFNNFKIVSGPNQSSSISMINGKVSSTITYSYIVVAPNTGKFTIDKATVQLQGKEYQSNTLSLSVVKSSGKTSTHSSSQSISDEELKKNVFIRAIADKRNVMQGEQVTVTYKLYTKLNISSPQISKLPRYKGFWTEELETSNNIRFDVEMYKGVRYRSAVLKKVALFPTKSGKLTVTPFELEIPVLIKRRQRSNDPFDTFFNDSFFGRTETVQFKATSNTVVVNASPLPEKGKPESFAGAVGQYNFKAELDKDNVETNEAVTIKLTVSGKGNIELIDMPDVELPPGFEKYDPKTSKKVNNKGTISGFKGSEYLIVPRVAGIKEIKPIKFSFFNPKSKKYVELSSSKFVLNIKQGSKTIASTTDGFTKEDIQLLSEDIRFIKTSEFNLEKISTGSLIKNWFWYSLGLPLILMLTFIGIKKRQDKLSGNVELMKFRKAEKNANNRLKSAKKAIEANDLLTYFNEISQGLYGYLEDKLALPKSEFSIENVVISLKKNNVGDSTTKEVESILNQCEFARFAPKSQSMEQAENLYDRSVKAIIEIENSVKTKKKKNK